MKETHEIVEPEGEFSVFDDYETLNELKSLDLLYKRKSHDEYELPMYLAHWKKRGEMGKKMKKRKRANSVTSSTHDDNDDELELPKTDYIFKQRRLGETIYSHEEMKNGEYSSDLPLHSLRSGRNYYDKNPYLADNKYI